MKKTQIILLQRMKNLGFIGDVVSVKPGYARNFLFPKKIALRATVENKAYFEEKKDYFTELNEERLLKAKTSAAEMDGYTLTIVRRASSNGRLYGSVAAKDLVDYLAEKGFKIKQHQVILPKPLKEIGVFTVPVSFHADIEINISVNIARSEQEADVQINNLMESLSNTAATEEEVQTYATTTNSDTKDGIIDDPNTNN